MEDELRKLLKQFTRAAGDEGQKLEAEIMLRLEDLFYDLITKNDLDMLTELLDSVAMASLTQDANRYQVAHWQACVLNERHLYQEAAAKFEDLLRKPLLDSLRARVYMAQGVNWDYRGLYNQAITCYEDSAAVFRKMRDAALAGEGRARSNQGIVLHELGRYQEAQQIFEENLHLARELDDPILEAKSLLEMGYCAKELGQWNDALTWYQASLQLWREQENQDHEARLLNNLGEVYHLLNQIEEAEASFKAALKIVLDPTQANNREAADMLHNLGFLYFTQSQKTGNSQDWEAEASTAYRQALDLTREAEDLATEAKLQYRLGTLFQQQGHVDQALKVYQVAVDLVEQLRSQAEDDDTRIQVLGLRQYYYQSMVLLNLEQDQIEAAFANAERAKSRAFYDLLSQQHLTESLPELKATILGETTHSITEIQARLSQDSALVEFFATGHVGPGRTMLDALPPESHYLRHYLEPPETLLAFVITKHKASCINIPIAETKIERAYFYRRGRKRFRGLEFTKGQPLSYPSRWRGLDEQLFGAIRPHLKNCQHVYLVPHGLLHDIPLHALSPQGRLTDNPESTTSYAPSAAILRETLSKPSSSALQTRRCLAIGVNESVGDDLAPLELAETQSQIIARQFGDRGQTLLGAEATAEAILSAWQEVDIVHFAGHGIFEAGLPLNSRLKVAGGDLTAQQILTSAKLKADLVTLSACETGLSDVVHGDELIGLVRAFMTAGARSLLVTLWQVAEIPTSLFLERFYQAWQGGMRKAEAVRDAQHYIQSLELESLRATLTTSGYQADTIEDQLKTFTDMARGPQIFAHPYYWAAFVLIGAPD